ncbi:MAG: hypothetical protein H6R25_2761 [Proteobacteria bacterium]|nr:hypothetical protein [Pseudomonadota bacterium]
MAARRVISAGVHYLKNLRKKCRPRCPVGVSSGAWRAVEEQPQQTRHGESDVLLVGNPLLGGLEDTTAAGFCLANLYQFIIYQ